MRSMISRGAIDRAASLMLDAFLFRKVSGFAWFGRSIRHQVLLAISLMLLLATIAAGTIAVVNGRNAVNVEIKASIDFAEGLLRELVRRIAAENQLSNLDYLVLCGSRPHAPRANLCSGRRHAAQSFCVLSSSDDDGPSPLSETPDWFESLMMPAGGEDHTRVIRVPNGDRQIILKGDPDDEIAEKWQQLSSLAIVASMTPSTVVNFYFVLGWILTPLQALARGLVALEAGENARRLEIPRVVEIADISRKFNSLAASLDQQTRAENGELYKQIQSVQEDERREIARELH